MDFGCGFSIFLFIPFVKVIDRDLENIDVEESFDFGKKLIKIFEFLKKF